MSIPRIAIPALPAPGQPQRGQWVWTMPGIVSLIFVAAIAVWASANDRDELMAYRDTLRVDAHSVQAQIQGRLDAERSRLRELAARLGEHSGSPEARLQASPEVIAGLDRLWNRVVWLDANHQVIARVTRKSQTTAQGNDGLRIQVSGQAEHLVVDIPSADGRNAGQILARYEVTDLLRSTDLGWLTQRYEVSFLSELDEPIATTASGARTANGEPLESALPGFRDTRLKLTPWDAPNSWKKSPRTLVLLGGLLVLGLAASEWLRREMRQVRNAVLAAQTEAAWRRSMEDSALVGLRARNLEGRILYVNKTLCDMVGYAREELLGLKPPLPFWPPEGIEAMMATNNATLAGEAPAAGYETRWLHRDGHSLHVMIFESPLIDAHGVHIGWMGSVVDISERKRLEERAQQHLDQMAQHARLNDLGLIASELAHELNQPLTALVSYSAGLGMALARRAAEDPEIVAAVAAMERNANRAGDIVNWIRRQSSRAEPQRTNHDLNALVRSALDQHDRLFQRNQTTLTFAPSEPLPAVEVDPIGIEQVIANLLRNATDATSAQAGVRSILVSTGTRLDESGAVVGAEVRVRDNGPGLQGRTMDMLCSTFYTTKKEGMGLGLGICRAIAESHGGELTACDHAEGGAEFCFMLPAKRATP